MLDSHSGGKILKRASMLGTILFIQIRLASNIASGFRGGQIFWNTSYLRIITFFIFRFEAWNKDFKALKCLFPSTSNFYFSDY
jgi:hypothetical protein